MKTCTKCLIEKDLEDFYKTPKGYRNGTCKRCIIDKQRHDRSTDPEYYERHKAASRKHGRKKPYIDYGADPADVDRLVERAETGLCEICLCTAAERKTDNKGSLRLQADHDHEFHKAGLRSYRGQLCSRCNTALGLMDDNADWLVAAAMYLIRHRTRLAQDLEMSK